MYLKQNQNGYSAVEIVLVVIVLGILGFTGWFVYHAKQLADNNYKIFPAGSTSKTSDNVAYEDCAKATGSKILQTYPEQCVSAEGKTYTNKGNSTSTNSVGTLKITEWGVSLPLTADITDATYTIESDGTAHVSTKKITDLAKTVTGCKAGINDIYVQRTSTAPTGEGVSAHIGKYYYSQYSPIEPSCAIPSSDAITQIGDLQKLLVDAIQGITLTVEATPIN